MPLWIVSSAGSGSADPLEPAAFELALHAQVRRPSICTSMMIVACGMPSFSASTTPTWPKPWSSDCRPVSTRSTCFVPERRGERVGDGDGVGGGQRVGLDVDGAVGAARERLADDLRRRAPGRREHDDHFPAVLLLQPQRLFERVGVGLVQLEAGVLIADPGLLVVDAHLPLARHDLLDADGDFHGVTRPT